VRKAIVALCVASICGAGSSPAASRVPTTVAVIGSGAKRALLRVDPRTLEPLGGARIRIPSGPSFALSPDSRRVAVARKTEVVIADTATGRVLRRMPSEGFDDSNGLYWVGTSAYPLIIAVGSSKFGYEYSALPNAGGGLDTVETPAVSLRGALVLTGAGGLRFFGSGESFVTLEGAPAGPFAVVADVTRGRVYPVFNAGIVAKVVGNAVTYHPVKLNGRAFSAIWAGHNEIAFWGADGLGIIDTRTWTTHAFAPAATGAVATRYGIVAWNADATDGVSVYSPNGRRRLHVLSKKQVVKVTALGRYAYAHTSEAKQYAIDLITGRVRVIRADAELAVPTLVSIP
jgi:hypothetical protein